MAPGNPRPDRGCPLGAAPAHNGQMTTMQLLSTVDDRGEQLVSVADNPDSLPPDQLRSRTSEPALIGSDDVVRFAWHLIVRAGYSPREVAFVDRYLVSVSPQLAEELSAELLQLLKTGPDWSELETYLRRELRDYYVLAIELRDRQEGGQVRISQQGVLTTESPNQPDRLRALLTGHIWRE